MTQNLISLIFFPLLVPSCFEPPHSTAAAYDDGSLQGAARRVDARELRPINMQPPAGEHSERAFFSARTSRAQKRRKDDGVNNLQGSRHPAQSDTTAVAKTRLLSVRVAMQIMHLVCMFTSPFPYAQHSPGYLLPARFFFALRLLSPRFWRESRLLVEDGERFITSRRSGSDSDGRGGSRRDVRVFAWT